MSAGVDWTTPLVVLGVATGVGAVLAYVASSGRTLPDAARLRIGELERERASMYAVLHDHHAGRAGQDPAMWASDLDRLEAAAAQVLRRLDAARREAGQTPLVRPPPTRAAAVAWQVAAIVVLVAAAATGLQGALKPKVDAMGGGGADAELAALRAAADANPADLAAQNAYGHALLAASDLKGAFQAAERVVAAAPDDPEARTHQAVVLLNMGDAPLAARLLDRVLARAPTFTEALGWRGALHFQMGEPEAAARVWEAALAADPSLKATLAPMIDTARDPARYAALTRAPTGAPDAPAAGSAAGGAPTTPDPADVTGTIAGDPSLLRPNDILFLSARPEGQTTGPPTWVARLPIASVPLEFRLGPANSMIGGATPERLVITARVDRDGDPRSKGPDDLEGRSDVLSPGASGVTITLTP